jgi:deoxyhypusine synthase
MSKHTRIPPKRKSPRVKSLQPTVPFQPEAGDSLPEILAKMSRTSFQGRNLGRAYQAWADAQKEATTIMFGLSGAMTAGGMRRLVVHLIRERMIDGIVSTGANLFHDIYESLGHPHYMGSPAADDMKLFRQRLDRVFDTYADEVEFRKLDWYLGHFMQDVAKDRRLGTREFFQLLADRLEPHKVDDGIVTAARKAGVPVYSPAIADSSYGIADAEVGFPLGHIPQIDVMTDVVETAEIALYSKSTSVVYVGGGTPKNFINQAALTASGWIMHDLPGHLFAIQFTADAPHWGGLSGCTFQEAQSWGKISETARMVTVHVDATIALPIVVSALAQDRARGFKRRHIPDMTKLYGRKPPTDRPQEHYVVDPHSQRLDYESLQHGKAGK